MKIKNFTAVTSVFQLLFVLRVMFRVYVYWSGSDTYPVFRTRFSLTADEDPELVDKKVKYMGSFYHGSIHSCSTCVHSNSSYAEHIMTQAAAANFSRKVVPANPSGSVFINQ